MPNKTEVLHIKLGRDRRWHSPVDALNLETQLFQGRSGRRDLATGLYNAIQVADPKMKNAFTPERAEKLLAKQEKKRRNRRGRGQKKVPKEGR